MLKAKTDNFWNQLESQQISKNQVEAFLTNALGQPTNLTQTNLLQEITKKINAYYFAQQIQNTTIYQLISTITKPEQIVEKQFREGKRKGQTYFILKIASEEGEEKLQAFSENLLTEKLNQIKQLAILGKKLVFKYKKWITNKQLLDFYPVPE